MIKHTLEISQRPARLSLRNKQLIIGLGGEGGERKYACEDVGILILQHPGITISTAVLNTLLEQGAAVIFCNEKHLPSGLLLPTTVHTELVPRMMAQIEAKKPARKRAWQAIVKAKIKAQASLLDISHKKKLLSLADEVASGDLTNCEAQAAKIYWQNLFRDRYAVDDPRDFSSDSLFNNLLNYGYAIIRAATARALVSSGLQPALGVFHHRRNNPFCLADDLIEPLRPLVDRKVREILDGSPSETPNLLTQDHRRTMLSLLTHPVTFKKKSGPLMATLPRYTAGFYRLITQKNKKFIYPIY